MPSYDATGGDPPAPVAQVALRNVHSGQMVADVPLLLDTGADVTGPRRRLDLSDTRDFHDPAHLPNRSC